MTDEGKDQHVIVTDVHMRFNSMVVFMVKWAIASIPALLIIIFITAFTWGVLSGLFSSAGSRGSRESEKLTSSSDTKSRSQVTSDAIEASAAVYLPHIQVKGIKVAETVLGGKGVFGEIKNNGDRTLTEVQITIYCLNTTNKPIFEKTYHPVLGTDFGFGDAAIPLKPGYSRKFGVKLDDAPSEWSGQVDVKVTKIDFAKS